MRVNSFKVLLCSLLGLISFAYGLLAKSSQEKFVTMNSTDMYVFAHSWSPEYCYSLTDAPGCTDPETYWGEYYTIHGLWPQYTTSGYPSYCTTEAFDSSVIDVIGWDTMTTYWPNVAYAVSDPDYTEFWEHEWSKHGTCTGLSQLDYFQNSLNLYKLYGTPAMVTSAVGSTLSAADLRTAMGGATKISLQCDNGKYLSGAFSCWSQVNGIPTTQTECPSDVQSEDTCSSSTLTVTAF